MRKKVSWMGWKKQLKQYVTSVSKVQAAEVNGENGKEENEVNGHKNQHQRRDVGDLGTAPLSSCEGLKSADAIQRGEKPQQIGIKSDARELTVEHLSQKPNSASAPHTSSPPLSNPAATTHGSVLKKVSFKHVYRSGPLRKFSSRTRSGANDVGPQRSDVVTRSGEPEAVAATRIQAAFRGYRSRRHSSADVWSEEKELGKTQASSTHLSQTDANRNFQTPPGAADKNINGEWDTDTRSPSDLEAIQQWKQEAILKRERQREYAQSLRRLRYGLQQKGGGRGLPADDKMLLDKPGYVLNWLERAQGSRDNRVLKNVTTDATNLPPSERSVVVVPPNKGITATDGEKNKSREKPKKNDDRKEEEPNAAQNDVTTEAPTTPTGRAANASTRASDVEQLQQNHFSPPTSRVGQNHQGTTTRRMSLDTTTGGGGGGKKAIATNERRKSYGGSSTTTTTTTTTTPSAATTAILQATTDRNLSSPLTGMIKAPILSGTAKKLPFKI